MINLILLIFCGAWACLGLYLIIGHAVSQSKTKQTFEVKEYPHGIDVIDSYKVLWDSYIINGLYKDYNWKRSKFSLYVEWFIHSLCYRIGYQRSRAKNVFFEWDKSWFRNLLSK